MFDFLAGVCSLIALIGFIILLIDAFRSALWKGLVSLFCCQIYMLYFAFVECDLEGKWRYIAMWLGGGLMAGVFQQLAQGR